MATDARLYCFDTFEGFDHRDVRTEAATSGVQARLGPFSDTSIELAVRNITDGMPSDQLVIRRGFFPETFGGLEAQKWRFVLLDADLYQPIKKRSRSLLAGARAGRDHPRPRLSLGLFQRRPTSG
jgi:O-methyltransferase